MSKQEHLDWAKRYALAYQKTNDRNDADAAIAHARAALKPEQPENEQENPL